MRLRFTCIFLTFLTASGIGPLALRAATAGTSIGELDLPAGEQPIKISLTASSPELGNYVHNAFNAHGRFLIVATGAAWSLNFTEIAANQIRVEGRNASGAAVFSQTATGKGEKKAAWVNALYRAADLAVKATSNLNGFFASQLAFVSTHTGKTEVYTGDLFLTQVQQVTTDRASVLTPRWVPGRKELIFTSYKTGFPDIYLLDPGSLQLTQFVSFKGTNSGARYSPNGQQVAMVLSGEGPTEIYVSDAQGRGIARKTHSDTVKASPNWSPDSTQLIFAMQPGPQLYRIPVSGGTPQAVPSGFAYAAEPDWSRADPNKLAFTAGTKGSYQVAVLDLSGSTPAKIVSDKIAATEVNEPVWLADGRHLVCTAKSSNSRVLCLLDTVTHKATRLSRPEVVGECSQASVLNP